MATTSSDLTPDHAPQPSLTTIFERLGGRFQQLRELSAPSSNGNGNGNGNGATDDQTLLGQPIVVPEPLDQAHTTDHRFAGFDLRSVAAVSVRFYGCIAVMVLVGTVVLWLLGSVLGVVSAFEEFMDGIGFTDFRILSLQFIFGLVLVSAAIAACMVGVTVVAAGLYNVLASRWGGVRIFVSDMAAGTPLVANGAATAPVANGAAPTAAADSAPVVVTPPKRVPKRAAKRPAKVAPQGNGHQANGHGEPQGNGTTKPARFPRRRPKPAGARADRPPRNGKNAA